MIILTQFCILEKLLFLLKNSKSNLSVRCASTCCVLQTVNSLCHIWIYHFTASSPSVAYILDFSQVVLICNFISNQTRNITQNNNKKKTSVSLCSKRRELCMCFLFVRAASYVHTIPYCTFTAQALQSNHSLLLAPWAIRYWFPCLRTSNTVVSTDRRWLHLHICSSHWVHGEPIKTLQNKARIFHRFDSK